MVRNGLVVLFSTLFTSCISVEIYHPLSALERAYIVDPAQANLPGVAIELKCEESDVLKGAAATQLCSKAEASLSAQGALLSQKEVAPSPERLRVTLRSRRVAESSNLWAAPLMLISWSVFPYVAEETIEHTMEVRDAQGFQLAEQHFTSRFVTYFGIAYFGLNTVLNWLVRDDEDDVTEESLKKHFSRDYYGHLSQMVYNAQLRARVLKLANQQQGGGP